ncbi:MAG: ribonuclease HII [Bacteroidales bacterium]|jgi:ribonuclease HII|nr:ribonuclease HII [Bacteroidales bacterium]
MLQPFYKSSDLLECGCDEAGRGCLAGPVVAAAVILKPDFRNDLLNDSKQLSERQRLDLRPVIEQNAIAYGVSFIDNRTIDDINILNASFKAMETAVKGLNVRPELLLIDGNRFRTTLTIPFVCIVKGDAKMMSIAAASILAKTYRDDYMAKIDADFPQYKWRKNKGYPTSEHRQAISQYGISPYHRKSFSLLPESTLF